LAKRVRPALPDFSGWNWVADSGPFSTAATNLDPYSAQETLGFANGVSSSKTKVVAPYEWTK
jgi:hypothetical protein